jgi:hypothetical protein
MKRLAVILAWQYSGRQVPIPGLIVDVFRVWSFFRELGYKFLFVTNMKSEHIPHSAMSQITSSEIDGSIYNFSSFLQSVAVEDVESKFNQLSMTTEVEEADEILVYFSGHGENKKIILPNGEFMNSSALVNFIPSDKKKTIIFDCCNPDSLGCSLVWKDNKFVYRNESATVGPSLSLKYDKRARILILASSEEEGTALAEDSGSLFTTCLIRLLKEMKKGTVKPNLEAIVEHMKENRVQIKIYTNRPCLYSIPSHLYSKSTVVVDYREGTVRVTSNP